MEQLTPYGHSPLQAEIRPRALPFAARAADLQGMVEAPSDGRRPLEAQMCEGFNATQLRTIKRWLVESARVRPLTVGFEVAGRVHHVGGPSA